MRADGQADVDDDYFDDEFTDTLILLSIPMAVTAIIVLTRIAQCAVKVGIGRIKGIRNYFL
jgi:hypothetical protein